PQLARGEEQERQPRCSRVGWPDALPGQRAPGQRDMRQVVLGRLLAPRRRVDAAYLRRLEFQLRSVDQTVDLLRAHLGEQAVRPVVTQGLVDRDRDRLPA